MSTAPAFDGAPERGTINFSVGQPSADLLPLALLRGACERYFDGAQPLELNYGARQGDVRFRDVARRVPSQCRRRGHARVAVAHARGFPRRSTSSAAASRKPGDTIFVEEPTYPYSFPIFRDHGLKVVGVPLDGSGMDLGKFEQLLAQHHPKLVYTIPSFHNPTGQTLALERRERLVELSRKHGFVIAADEVYQLLHHGTPPPASFGTLAERGNVVSLGSFSKILAPGLRLGWIQANPELMQRMLAQGALVSGGNFNHFASHVVRQLMESGRTRHFRRSPAGELRGAGRGDG